MIWCKNNIWIDKIQSTFDIFVPFMFIMCHMYNTFFVITLPLYFKVKSIQTSVLPWEVKHELLNVLYNTAHIKSAIMYIKWLSISGLSWLDFVQHMHSSFHSKKSISNNSSTKMHFRSEFPCESKSALASSLNVSDVIQ